MTSHHSQSDDQFYDPDFDTTATDTQQKKSAQSSTVTLQIHMTPKKLFFAGFAVSILVMSIPLTYLATKVSSQDKRGTNVAAAAVDQGDAPSAPSPLQPQPTSPSAPVKPVSKDDHVRGNKGAALSIIEYSDFECPFCKRFHPTVQQALKEYDGKVNWVYRHFPLSFHANAAKESEAAECAQELGGSEKFWEYTDKIFERTASNGTGFALDALVPLAKELGLNEKKFKECLDSGKYAAHVQQDFSEGQTAGIDGTPGNILLTQDGKEARVPGAVPYEQLKAEIDRLFSEKQ